MYFFLQNEECKLEIIFSLSLPIFNYYNVAIRVKRITNCLGESDDAIAYNTNNERS